MSIKCYIIDDEAAAIVQLKRELEKIPVIDIVGFTTDPFEGLEFLKVTKVDVVFLDISMKKITGLELVRLISNKVVFITANEKNAIDALAFANVIDFIVKPFRFDRIAITIQKIEAIFPAARDFVEDEGAQTYPMKTVSGVQEIPFKEIVYIEASGYFSTAHLNDMKAKVALPLINVEILFPKSLFVRVHRSCIVNRKRITKTIHGDVIMDNGDVIKLGAAFKDNLKKFRSK
ncbi:LytTR family DNA-binding domain-containing protein [Pedobacter nutrimenti]|uniref:LytR/AlgR family response regulator transcription factor n=1 Tax=Pedobacter nutrimenti TaxID=1241337 RepID=UPI0029314061|nr:LytTR family DNA-binding domain-containing protein [Pedobacter nutrimenti]